MAGKIELEKWDTTKYGALNMQNMVKKLSAEGYSCTDYTFQPGMLFPDHTHSVSKKDAIVSGRFKFGIYGQEIVLEPGDMVVVPRGIVHKAEVLGVEPVCFIDATKR